MNDTIIITGVDGFLGGKITKRILEETNMSVLGLTMNLEFPPKMLVREGIKDNDRFHFILNEEFLNGSENLSGIYGAVHLAFSRRIQPAKDIASSIDFAAAVFHKLAEMKVDRVINMSSQGVYGNTDEIRTEQTCVAPENNYTMAKYATEKLFEDILKDVPHHTSLRLDPVAPSQSVIKGLCKAAKEGQINLRGGRQVFSFIDPEDVCSAVLEMLNTDGEWDHIYNVGWNQKRYTLIELAKLIADITEECGYKRPQIKLEESDISIWAGMNSTKFMSRTGWRPQIDLASTCKTLIQE